ncbi:peptidase M4 [Leptotrichia sp. OH3620_COT-345]|uniref:PepSY domain-containing protein n=1 Tax=Leptotrichia sp. OH3620_COT-345 TaxID=2491048 RepID=UPI000F64E016|nr:PepSY domain-containing protein [Leptotrichia sp. OH3620_COT-345]RRD40211.1 peptidase M4 [Leptotrichia sp. OH3620_COT-345]
MRKKILKITLLGMMLLSLLTFGNKNTKSMYSNFSTKTQSNYIGESKAKSIALARVPGAKNRHIVKLHLDREDGRVVYEGKIIYNGVEYEFDIDAVTGKVISWDVDRD